MDCCALELRLPFISHNTTPLNGLAHWRSLLFRALALAQARSARLLVLTAVRAVVSFGRRKHSLVRFVQMILRRVYPVLKLVQRG